jgi:hypothetical protein
VSKPKLSTRETTRSQLSARDKQTITREGKLSVHGSLKMNRLLDFRRAALRARETVTWPSPGLDFAASLGRERLLLASCVRSLVSQHSHKPDQQERSRCSCCPMSEGQSRRYVPATWPWGGGNGRRGGTSILAISTLTSIGSS